MLSVAHAAIVEITIVVFEVSYFQEQLEWIVLSASI